MLGKPLPEEDVNSTVLGKFKLEDKIVKGYFLAPKSYTYTINEGSSVVKFKGPAKMRVSPEWFEEQYADLSRTEEFQVEANFRIDWHTLNITKKKTLVKLGIKEGTKRIPVYQGDQWVDTIPIDVTDLSLIDNRSQLIIKSLLAENLLIKDKLSQKEREIDERYKEIETSLTEDRTLLDKEEEHPR